MKILKAIIKLLLWPLHRGRLFIIVFLISLVSFGQKVFIGMTEDQVEDYWSTRESVAYFRHFEDSTEKTSSFGIYHDSSPTFDATFKNGKCTEHEMKISWEQTSIMEARIQKMGYSYNKKDDCWYNPSKSISWKTSQISDWFVLTCKKLK